jgi:hypothetical protein
MATTTDKVTDPTLNGVRIGSPADGFKLAAEPSTGINSGLNVTSQVEVGPTKPVDRKTLEGSTPGDFRSQAADAVLPANPGPRDETGQAGA